jgi:hypothetical protein
MVRPSTSAPLGRLRYSTLILRFLLDRRGRLVQCEVVGSDARVRARFMAWRDMPRAVRASLATERFTQERDDVPPT